MDDLLLIYKSNWSHDQFAASTYLKLHVKYQQNHLTLSLHIGH